MKVERKVERFGLAAGPAVAIALLLLEPPTGVEPVAWSTAAVASLMAVWWITEAIPIAATALVPLVAFPLLGIADIVETARPYANPVIFLFLGGFVLAAGLERSGLHVRIAGAIVHRVGQSRRRLVAGFLVATALSSMWVSNTATAVMMVPMALSVITMADADTEGTLATAVLLAVAYGANIGGVGTLVGTPPNALLAGWLLEARGIELGFLEWLAVGIPFVAMALPLTWLVLVRRVGEGVVDVRLEPRGALNRREIAVTVIGVLVAGAWVSRPLLERAIPGLSDAGIAMAGALLLFALPVRWRPFERIIDWSDVEGIPWSVLVLFGGGLSLASSVESSGLAGDIGHALEDLAALPVWLLVGAVTTVIVFLTELTSNTATAATFLPICGALALGIGVDPMILVVPAAVAASCAFMMPVATPPNAIVYGSGHLTIRRMARAGIVVNLLAIAVIEVVALVMVPRAL